MDSELFSLCKEVYEKTGWKTPHEEYELFFNTRGELSGYGDFQAPLYNSDLIMEKLPYGTTIEKTDKGYAACKGLFNGSVSNTPLKSLLKLTLVLHETGELG